MTTNEIAVRTAGGSQLAIESDQSFWTEKQIAALRQLGMKDASNGDLAVFFHQATRTGLDPFARQIYMIERQGKQTIQTGIDGFRLIARRTTDQSRGSFGYEDTLWCGDDGQWVDVWLKRESPRAAKVTVVRDGQRYPAVALWDEYVGTKRGGEITQMWATKGALMLAKCAEALALRRAFPQDLSGLYTSEELQQADTPAQPPPPAPGAGADRARDVLNVQPSQEPAEHDQQQVDGITADQVRKLGTCMTKAGLTDRDSVLKYVADVIGRTVASRNDLTKSEASRVIDALEQGRTVETPTAPADDVVEGEIVEDPPADDADMGDPAVVWRQIEAAAATRGLGHAPDLEQDVALFLNISSLEASAEELQMYLAELLRRDEVAA